MQSVRGSLLFDQSVVQQVCNERVQTNSLFFGHPHQSPVKRARDSDIELAAEFVLRSWAWDLSCAHRSVSVLAARALLERAAASPPVQLAAAK